MAQPAPERVTVRLPNGKADRERLEAEADRRGVTPHRAVLQAMVAAGLVSEPRRAAARPRKPAK